MFTKYVRLTLSLVAVAALMLLNARQAAAHANPVRMEPAQNAVLAAAPSNVTIYFSEAIESDGSTLVVVDAAGATVSAGAATILADDNKALRVELRAGLPAGRYTVRWNSRSAADGDDAEGTYTFSVAAEGVAATGSAAPVTQLPNTGMLSFSGITLLGSIGASALMAGYTIRRLTSSRRRLNAAGQRRSS